VANAQGQCEHRERGYVLVDLPGTYSLMAHSAEEEVARDFLCFGGAAALIVYGVLSILVPSVPAQISGSSMIRIDGSGIFLLLCVAAIAAGAALLLKSTKHK